MTMFSLHRKTQAIPKYKFQDTIWYIALVQHVFSLVGDFSSAFLHFKSRHILMILHGGEVITSYSKYSYRKILNINLQIKFRVHFCRYLYPSWLWHSLAPLKIIVLHLSCDLPWRCAHGLLARRGCWLRCTLPTGLWIPDLFLAFLTKWVCTRYGCSVENKSKQPNTYRKRQNQLTVRTPWVHTRSYYDANEGMTCPVTSMLLKK